MRFCALKRGHHPNARGGFTTTGELTMMNYPLLAHIDEISPQGRQPHDLMLQERAWYIRAVHQLGWSKRNLRQMIIDNLHLGNSLDFTDRICYTDENPTGEEVPVYDRSPEESKTRLLQHLGTLCPDAFDGALAKLIRRKDEANDTN